MSFWDFAPYYGVWGPSYIWKNSGVLSITAAPGATLQLGDYFTTDELESGFLSLGVHLDLSQFESVQVVGTLDNSPADNPITGGTLTLNASSGPLYLTGGEIDGGKITGTAPILANGATLNGVIVDAPVDVTGSLTLEGNWSTTVNAPITATNDFATINLSGTWTNNGTIAAAAGTLDLSGTWTNNAAITDPGGTFDLSGTWTNNGTITATGSTLNLYDTWTNNGIITADAASTVSLGNDSNAVSGPGDIWKNTGTLAIAPGATIYLGDFFTTDEFESGFHSLGVDLDLSHYTVYLVGILDNSAADNPITRGTLAMMPPPAHCTSASTLPTTFTSRWPVSSSRGRSPRAARATLWPTTALSTA